MRKPLRAPKAGDTVKMSGATLIATEMYDDHDTGVPTIVFTPATKADAEKLGKREP